MERQLEIEKLKEKKWSDAENRLWPFSPLWTDGRTEGQTDKGTDVWTHPLIAMRGRIEKGVSIIEVFSIHAEKTRTAVPPMHRKYTGNRARRSWSEFTLRSWWASFDKDYFTAFRAESSLRLPSTLRYRISAQSKLCVLAWSTIWEDLGREELVVAWGHHPGGSQFSLCQLGSFQASLMYEMRIKTWNAAGQTHSRA